MKTPKFIIWIWRRSWTDQYRETYLPITTLPQCIIVPPDHGKLTRSDFMASHPMMNLFEGNYLTGTVKADLVWGSSSHNTFFRNRNTLDPSRAQAAWNYSLYQKSNYFNIIGNVIGTVGFENSYSIRIGSSSKAIYGIDPAVSTTLHHGNWDSVINGVVWNGSDDRVLPASLYLSGKPNWWGNMQWPAIGPDVSPMYPAAPVIGQGTPWGSSKSSLSPPLSSPKVW